MQCMPTKGESHLKSFMGGDASVLYSSSFQLGCCESLSGCCDAGTAATSVYPISFRFSGGIMQAGAPLHLYLLSVGFQQASEKRHPGQFYLRAPSSISKLCAIPPGHRSTLACPHPGLLQPLPPLHCFPHAVCAAQHLIPGAGHTQVLSFAIPGLSVNNIF